MMKRWKKLSELDCVKEYGIRHKLAHLFGVHMNSMCSLSLGKLVIHGIQKGLK